MAKPGPVYYLPHGGGPLPLMGDPNHAGMVALHRGLAERVAGCPAVVVVTAHWEAAHTSFSGAERPAMLFDYYGFPPETYTYRYPAPGAPELAKRAGSLLAAAGLESEIDGSRGYDHGTFVPMMLIRSEADVQILQMSLLSSLDPAAQIAVGRALAPLLAEGVAIVGSGMSFHNLGALLGGRRIPEGADRDFDSWLDAALTDPDLGEDERADRLAHWQDAPGARAFHPREEHLLPLHACFGAASAAGYSAESIFREPLMGYMTSGYAWNVA